MDNCNQDEIVEYTEELFKCIDDKENIIPFIKLTGNDQLVRQCDQIHAVQAVINRSLQMGHYRRALKYIIVLKNTLDAIEGAEEEVRRRMSDIILK